MLPNPFAKIMVPAGVILDTQEAEGMDASAETAGIKVEQQDEPVDAGDYDHDNDSVITTSIDEHDLVNDDDEVGFEEQVSDHGTPPESAFYRYSKYVDDAAEPVVEYESRDTPMLLPCL
jgi:hypothetical protein